MSEQSEGKARAVDRTVDTRQEERERERTESEKPPWPCMRLATRGIAGSMRLATRGIAGSMRLATNHLKTKRAIRQARTIKSTRIERESENRERREYLD